MSLLYYTYRICQGQSLQFSDFSNIFYYALNDLLNDVPHVLSFLVIIIIAYSVDKLGHK